MPDQSMADLDSLLDGQKIGPRMVLFLAIATLAMLADGYDLSAIGLAAPELVRTWHVARAALAPMLSAGIIGLLVGAPLFGFLGDRIGRKKTILIGLCGLGMVTLATMAAGTLQQFVVLRFLTGIVLGGTIPNLLALTAEVAPKRLRGLFLIVILFGVPAGIAIPGLVAAALVPQFGWQVLMLVGGVLPLITACMVLLFPESIRFLAQRGGREADVARQLQALRPDLPLETVVRACVPCQDVARAGLSPSPLFAGSLALITPALWVALAANQMANFFALSWLPTLLQAAGASTAQAGLNASLFSIGGLAGGLCLTFLMDRLGALPMVVLFLLGIPLVAAIGYPELPPLTYALIIAGAGFCVTGINFAMSAMLGMIYPTRIRALGTGGGQAIGRVGSLVAPIVGGVLFGLHLPIGEMLLAPAFSLAIGAVAAVLLSVFCVRRFAGYRLDDEAAETPRAAPALLKPLPPA